MKDLIVWMLEIMVIILFFWFISKGCKSGCDYIQEHGIKGVATDIWEGTGPDSTKVVEE